MSTELRHRTYLYASINDEFPRPREKRLLVVRLKSVPIYCRTSIVALPDACDERIDSIGPNEFDHQFAGYFTLKGCRIHRSLRQLVMDS